MPILDWRPNHDPRSRDYPIREMIGAVERQDRQWDPGQMLDQGPDGACFPADTFVRLADGSHKRIADLRLLDSVVTAEGRTGPVTQLMVRRANRGLVAVKADGHAPLRCTPEHPILTTRGYVPAEALTPGDRVAITRHTDRKPTRHIDVARLVDLREFRGTREGTVNAGGVESKVAALPDVMEMTPSFGRLLGLYAAEGHTSVNKVTWSYGKHEEHTLVAETARLIEEVFGVPARIQHRPNDSFNVIVYGKPLRYLFDALVPGTSKHGDKHLSHHATNGPDDYRQALIEGWLDGDGHARRTDITGITVSTRLALDMHAIANDAGKRPCFRVSAPTMNRHAKTRQMRHEVGFSTNPTPNTHGRTALLDDDATWRTVREITPEEYDGYVYNIEVEGDHSYVANGIGVHNCVGFAFASEALAAPIRVDLNRLGIYAPTEPNLFAHFLYGMAQYIDEWQGQEYEGTSVNAGAQAAHNAGLLKEWRWAFGLNDVLDAVSAYGPVVIGTNWYSGMNTAPGGVVRLSGNVVGGHAVTLTGYTRSNPKLNGAETVTIKNSWGPGWGQSGFADLPTMHLARLLSERGEACVPVSRSYGR